MTTEALKSRQSIARADGTQAGNVSDRARTLIMKSGILVMNPMACDAMHLTAPKGIQEAIKPLKSLLSIKCHVPAADQSGLVIQARNRELGHEVGTHATAREHVLE